jgi:FAD binding domain
MLSRTCSRVSPPDGRAPRKARERFPPAGATRVSAAIHDVHNLAWKIAAVVHGHGGEKLLDSYATEREPVGRRNAAETGTAWTRIFAGNGVPFSGRSLAQLDMGYQYASPVNVGDDSPDADPPRADYRQSAAPGCRAPHLWRADGTSTIDLFDQRFVLLTAEPGHAWRAAAARCSVVPVDCHILGEPQWPDLYGVAADGAVLVRPDGHVAWRSATTSLDSVADFQTALTTAGGMRRTQPKPSRFVDGFGWEFVVSGDGAQVRDWFRWPGPSAAPPAQSTGRHRRAWRDATRPARDTSMWTCTLRRTPHLKGIPRRARVICSVRRCAGRFCHKSDAAR